MGSNTGVGQGENETLALSAFTGKSEFTQKWAYIFVVTVVIILSLAAFVGLTVNTSNRLAAGKLKM